MGFFGSIDRAALDKAFAAPEPETLPFGEGFDAVRESTFLTDRTDSLSYQAQEAASRSLARLRDLGVDVPEFPSWTWSNRQTKAALAVLDQKAADVAALRSPESGPPDPFLKTGAEIRKEAEERVAQARARASRAGFGAQLAGGMDGQITDPLNVALLPLGVARAEGLLAKVAIEAAVGAASQTAVEAASLEAKDFAGVSPTTGEVVGNIALTGAFGAGLAGLFHGAGVVARRAGLLSEYRRKVASGEVTPTRELDAAADSLQDAIDTIPPRATPEAEAAHLDAVAAATDALRAEHPIEQAAALRRVQEAEARLYEAENAAMMQDAEARGVYDPQARESAPEAAAVAADVAPDTTPPASAVAPSPVAAEPTKRLAVDYLAEIDKSIDADEKRALAEAGKAREKRRSTLLAEIRRRGGMNAESIRPWARERNLGHTGMLAAFRKGALGVDVWHANFLSEGLVPQWTTLDDFVEMLSAPTDTLEAQTRKAARELEATESVETARAYVREMYDAVSTLRTIKNGVEPTVEEMEAYLANPRDFHIGAERTSIDTEVAAEMADPLPVLSDYDDAGVDGVPEFFDFLSEDERAAFEQHIADSPDAPGAYIAEDGNLKAGTARELVASLAEDERELRGILDCVLTPGGAD